MTDKKEIVLSPSAAERWFHCEGSEFVIKDLPRLPSSSAAEEGTLAHTFAAWTIANALRDATDVAPVGGFPPEPAAALATDEMLGAAQTYADSILAKLCDISTEFAEDKDFCYGVEALCESVSQAAHVRGRIDFFAKVYPKGKDKGRLIIADFKYGSTLVSAADNKQMLTYAACIMEEASEVMDLSIGIVQPRSAVSDFSEYGAVWKDYTYEEFCAAFKPIAAAARAAVNADAKSPRNPGDWCAFCPARSVCRAAIGEKMLLAGIAAGESEMATDATDEQIGAWLDALKAIENARGDLSRIAKARIHNGAKIPGWRISQQKTKAWESDIIAQASPAAQARAIQDGTGIDYRNFLKEVLVTHAEALKVCSKDELSHCIKETSSPALIKEK